MANIDLPLSSFGIIWDGVGYLRLLDVPVLFPGPDSDPVARRGGNQGLFMAPVLTRFKGPRTESR